MRPQDLAARIDHTLLTPEATSADIDRLVDEAVGHRFASACVQPRWVSHAAERAAGRVAVCCVIGFPHGANRPTVKAIEATAAVKDGAAELDMVAFLPDLLARDVRAVRAEVMEVARAARAVNRNVILKVIVESALLVAGRPDGEAEAIIADACRAVREAGADFIKTSTGFHPAGGADPKVIAWMAAHASGLGVKASGGIRTLAHASALLDAGATRLGASRSLAILREASEMSV